MSELFIELLNLSIMAGWLILAVMLVRILLKKAPKYIRCILWDLVGLRLICPVSIESVFSLLPSGKVIEPEIVYDRTPAIHSGITMIDHTTNTIMAESFTPNMSDSVNPLQVVTYIASNFWVIGLVVMLIYCVVSYALIKRRVFDAVKTEDNIYESDKPSYKKLLSLKKELALYIVNKVNNEINDINIWRAIKNIYKKFYGYKGKKTLKKGLKEVKPVLGNMSRFALHFSC